MYHTCQRCITKRDLSINRYDTNCALFIFRFSMSKLLNNDDDLCEIKEISPLYRLFNEYKNEELMYTITFLILLMYLEEFLFAFRKKKCLKSMNFE